MSETRTKYNTLRRGVELDGQRFDSRAEAEYWRILKLRQVAGELHSLTRQPSYTLQDSFVDSRGHKIAAIRYTGDFEYVETATSQRVCCEVKGVRTRDWAIRERLFRWIWRGQVELVVVPASEVI